MASGTTLFQTAVTATPPSGLPIMADSVNDTDHGVGTAQYIKIMDGRTAGTIKAAVTANGIEADVTRVQGTVQVLGSVQTVGTSQALGTFQAVGTFPIGTIAGTVQVLGTFQSHGTTQAIGTVQPLAGSVNAQGVIAHGAVIAGNPLLFAGFGSSGTQAAVDDGDIARLWTDLNGRLQVRGTIDSIPSITVASMPTITGTVQTHGTSQALGTFQPLAGSVHLATPLPGGTIVAVGSAVHGAVADARPLLISAFGSSGTQTAVDDGDAVRLWADLNGRLQVRGTIDSLLGTVQTHGTSQAIGTFQPLAGSVHLANTFPGGTSHIGSVQGTVHIGSVQRLTGGTLDFLGGTVAVGTVRQLLGTVLTRPNQAAGEGFFGTRFTAAVTNGTLVPAPASGTYIRVWDVMVSGSAAGTAFLELGDGTIFQPVYLAANGGYVMSSAKGIRTNGTAQDILFNSGAGSWSVSISYTLENA